MKIASTVKKPIVSVSAYIDAKATLFSRSFILTPVNKTVEAVYKLYRTETIPVSHRTAPSLY